MARGGSRYGAGRPGWRAKAEGCMRLDVRDLDRRQLLRTGFFTWRWSNSYTGEEVGSISIQAASDSLELRFNCDGRPVAQHIVIDRTPCPFGGSRPWLRCDRCFLRVAVLYLRGGRFTCRHCGRVAYSSQSEDALGRTWRRQNKLESRLGEDWKRPTGMRRATFESILSRIWDCEEQRDDAICHFLARHGLTDWR